MEKFNFKEHWQGFLDGKIAVNCRDEKFAEEFLQYCHEQDLKWSGESSLINSNFHWNTFGENIYYNCKDLRITYGHSEDYSYKEYEKVEFDGFYEINSIKEEIKYLEKKSDNIVFQSLMGDLKPLIGQNYLLDKDSKIYGFAIDSDIIDGQYIFCYYEVEKYSDTLPKKDLDGWLNRSACYILNEDIKSKYSKFDCYQILLSKDIKKLFKFLQDKYTVKQGKIMFKEQTIMQEKIIENKIKLEKTIEEANKNSQTNKNNNLDNIEVIYYTDKVTVIIKDKNRDYTATGEYNNSNDDVVKVYQKLLEFKNSCNELNI